MKTEKHQLVEDWFLILNWYDRLYWQKKLKNQSVFQREKFKLPENIETKSLHGLSR